MIECADPILRALLSESLSDTLARLLALERPHGSYDDTPDGHEAFTRTVLVDYDRQPAPCPCHTPSGANGPRRTVGTGMPRYSRRCPHHHWKLALPFKPADPITCTLSPTHFSSTLTGTLLVKASHTRASHPLSSSAAPTEERLDEAIDAVAGAAVTLGVRICDLVTHVDADATSPALNRPCAPSEKPTNLADRILYVGRDGARVHVKGDASSSTDLRNPATSLPKNNVARIVLSGNVGLSAGARSWAMRSSVDVVCLSRRGSYQGSLVGANRGTHASRLSLKLP